MEYAFPAANAVFTKKDVDMLKRSLRTGDTVWVEIEREEFADGNIRRKTVFRKRKVVKMYRNVVEVQTTSTKRVTLTYKDILVNNLKRKQKANEGSMV